MTVYTKNAPNFSLPDARIAITYGMLSAKTLGLGSSWIGLAYGAFRSNEELRENVAKIPRMVHGVFVLGYPAVKYARSPPRPKIRTSELN